MQVTRAHFSRGAVGGLLSVHLVLGRFWCNGLHLSHIPGATHPTLWTSTGVVEEWVIKVVVSSQENP